MWGYDLNMFSTVTQCVSVVFHLSHFLNQVPWETVFPLRNQHISPQGQWQIKTDQVSLVLLFSCLLESSKKGVCWTSVWNRIYTIAVRNGSNDRHVISHQYEDYRGVIPDTSAAAYWCHQRHRIFLSIFLPSHFWQLWFQFNTSCLMSHNGCHRTRPYGHIQIRKKEKWWVGKFFSPCPS